MKLEITFNLHQLEQFAASAPAQLRAELRATLTRIAARVEKTVSEKTPRGVGGAAGLAGSIVGEVLGYGESLMARIGTPLEYGEVVELGRRPGKARPPIAPLELWLQRKIGLGPEEAHRAAYGLAISIARHGFEGAHMFERSMTELDSWISHELAGIPGRVAERITHAAG